MEESLINKKTSQRKIKPILVAKPPLSKKEIVEKERLRKQRITNASLAKASSQRLKNLLKKNREDKINSKESTELDNLLVESDQIALLKAKAEYKLEKIQGK